MALILNCDCGKPISPSTPPHIMGTHVYGDCCYKKYIFVKEEETAHLATEQFSFLQRHGFNLLGVAPKDLDAKIKELMTTHIANNKFYVLHKVKLLARGGLSLISGVTWGYKPSTYFHVFYVLFPKTYAIFVQHDAGFPLHHLTSRQYDSFEATFNNLVGA